MGSKGRAGELGPTRQEPHILHLLRKGAANKTIAEALALSKATLKLYLANFYRNLGCGALRETVAADTALQLVG